MTAEQAPRITFSLTETGTLELYLNEAGRDLLVKQLQALNEQQEHFHFDPEGTVGLEVGRIPYRDTDRILDWGKVYFRLDEWDARYFPHVLSKPEPTDP